MNDDTYARGNKEQGEVAEKTGGGLIKCFGQVAANQQEHEEEEHPEDRAGNGDPECVNADFSDQLEDQEGYNAV
jgi:hypothetical protein